MPDAADAADSVDVAIVGGGPAGAALAIRLAYAGVHAVILERRAQPTWRACGVFSSPLTRDRLVDLGLSPSEVSTLQRPISALRLQTTGGRSCRIEYREGLACGFDRVRLDGLLLDRARALGVDVRLGSVVRHVQLPADRRGLATVNASATDSRPNELGATAVPQAIRARLVVGADGSSSVVSRAAGVHRTSRFLARMGITFHRRDPDAAPEGEPTDGRFVFGSRWYVGIAPVPERRVNVGMVVPSSFAPREAPPTIAERLIAAFPGPREAWMSETTTDHVAVAGRLEHHVTHAAGGGYLLVGDAIQFIDPLTGEGLLRALISAELAADAVVATLQGDRSALGVYDRRIRARWRSKNLVSWILQAFLMRPGLLDYALRRLAARDRLREDLTLVLTDQARASRALDPRFLARLLGP